MPKAKIASVMLLAGLSGACAGSDHKLPTISEAERAEAYQEIVSAPPLRPTDRLAAENERLARQVLGRVQAAAAPVCLAAGRSGCWYTLVFSPEGQMNAGILKNRMVFYNGLAQYLETEDEFAAVISHEVGHHIARHHEERAQNRFVGAMIGALIFGGISGATGAYKYRPYSRRYDMRRVMDIGRTLGQISYSKEQETEADYIGAYLMTRAGYNPVVAKDVWVKLTKTTGRMEKDLLSTHPAGPDRLASWKRAVQEVRYSADLIPNSLKAPEETPLQVARSFDNLPAPAAAITEAAASAGALRPTLANYQAFAAAPSQQRTRSVPKTGTKWAGGGNNDACGNSWALDLEVSGQEVSGTLRWSEIDYDLGGRLDKDGETVVARAAKSRAFSNAVGPRFFEIDLTFQDDEAGGHYAIKKYDKLSCSTEITLGKL